jgi:hypothetical protein
MSENYTLQKIGQNSSIVIWGGILFGFGVFIISRDIIFSFYDSFVKAWYCYDDIGKINSWIEIFSWVSFFIHGAIRCIGLTYFENKDILKAHMILVHLLLLAIAYITYIYLIFKFLNTL